jgi:D-glycero-D-manno-heptose 1,7-bisphosphate phosphatase
MKARAIFLDRDGTLNVDTGYLKHPEHLKLLPTVSEALEAWQQAGFKLFIVTNQSGIARGYFTHETLEKIHQKLQSILSVPITEIAYCPHQERDQCACRKPKPQMILDLAFKHEINLQDSFMIGDKPSDWEAGQRAGVKSFQIKHHERLVDFVSKTVDFSKISQDFNFKGPQSSEA